MSKIFDEYEEETNEFVSFGILYTHRAMSERFISEQLSTKECKDIMTIMKLSAIKAIRKELDEEYSSLEKEYSLINNSCVEIKG